MNEVRLVSTEFVNTLTQHATVEKLLPFDAEEMSAAESTGSLTRNIEVEYEPSATEVFRYLVPKYMEIIIYGAVIESATCEHAARRMAMENATDNANEILSDLSLYYNRARQAAITNEIIEVISGSEAQK